MRIQKSVLDIIDNSISGIPPETGGILGSSNNTVIDEIIMDLPNITNTRPCSYSPNIDFLNRSIEVWLNSGIAFMGIFHTHFMGVNTLSVGDKKYINAIIYAMPEQINALYFPIYVLPNRELICYKAKRSKEAVDIQAEDIVIV